MGVSFRQEASRPRLVFSYPPHASRGRLASCLASRGRLASVVLLVLAGALPALAQSSKVEITGGIDNTNQKYAWTMTNHSASPIVYVEIPHYHADLFTTPPGWEQKCTNLRMIGGGDDAPGVCTATMAAGNIGIPPGGTAQFGLRIAREGANRGRDVVKVRLADGTALELTDVELPVAPTFFEQFGTVLGLSALLVAFIAVQIVRQRRRRAAVTSTPVDQPAAG